MLPGHHSLRTLNLSPASLSSRHTILWGLHRVHSSIKLNKSSQSGCLSYALHHGSGRHNHLIMALGGTVPYEEPIHQGACFCITGGLMISSRLHPAVSFGVYYSCKITEPAHYFTCPDPLPCSHSLSSFIDGDDRQRLSPWLNQH